MGQYHKLVALTCFEFLENGDLGCKLKACEMIASRYRINATLAALISANPGSGTADLPHNPFVGRWAGQRMLCIGDYAEDGDAANIPGYSGPALSGLYHLLDDENLLPEEKAPGVFYNISPNVRGMLEHGCSVRFVRCDWPTHTAYTCVPVKSSARAGSNGRTHFDIVGDQAALTRYQRDIPHYGTKPWDRPSANGSTDIADEDLGKGQVRVLANYDRREFIDPVAFGEMPTTAGIMRGDWGSAAAIMGMLFEPEARGSGDIEFASSSRLIGLWRNDRLFATSELEHRELPTTDYVKANWTDLSHEAVQFIAAIADEIRPYDV